MKSRTLIALLGLGLLATLLLGGAGFEGAAALAVADEDGAAAIPSLPGLLRNVFGWAS